MISNLSIKSKLVLLLLAPLLTLLVFAGIAVADRFETAGVANDATSELEVAQSTMFVVGELSAERSTTVQLLINSRDGRDEVDAARERADEAIAALTDQLENDSVDLDSRAEALAALDNLIEIRRAVDTFAVESPEAYAMYNDVVDGLLTLEVEIMGQLGDTDLLREGQLTLAGVQGRERVYRQAAFLGPRLELVELTGPDYVAFSGLQNEERLFFGQLEGSDEISELWQTSQAGTAATSADELIDAVNVAGQGGSIPNVTAAEWWPQMTAKAEAFDIAAIGSFDILLETAESKASSARNGAILFGVVALFIILLAVLMALALGRSIARRLLRLSEEANTIATDRLPEVLESLRNPTPEALSGAMPTIDSDATDEIGVMADSFDTVLRTSVETAIEHSQQRAKTITDLLVNLGRRNQLLIGNQLSLIDELEAKEEDPELLESLYSLDSLITRNRRNSENLLVLAGETANRASNAPVSMYEIVQAAMGEVSELHRVEITGEEAGNELLLGKPAVNLSHLVAELLDNALSFSAKSVTAHIECKMGEHRIWVIDEGVGMTDEELEEANARLADPTDIDEMTTDRIGFQVVGRIAQRLGTTVALTRNPYGGLAASIDVPRDLLLSNASASTVEPAKRATGPGIGSQVISTADDDIAPDVIADETSDAPDVSDESLDNAETADAEIEQTEVEQAGGEQDKTRTDRRKQAAAARAKPAEARAKSSAATKQPAAAPKKAAPAATGAAASGQLNRRTPGTSLTNDLKEEAQGRVTHRRLGDGKQKSTGERADQRQAMNSRLARNSNRRPAQQSADKRPAGDRRVGGPTLAGATPEPTPEPQPVAAAGAPAANAGATGQLNRRTPGTSLANDLKEEAQGRVTHRRLGDGRPTGNRERAERRKAMNSKLARNSELRQESKEQKK